MLPSPGRRTGLWHSGRVPDYYTPVLWSLTIVLTVLAGGGTFLAWRAGRRRRAVRGAALTLLPVALLFTGTLTLLMRWFDATVDWAGGFVFRPTVWIGLILFVVALVTWLLAGRLAPDKARSPRSVDDAERARLPQTKTKPQSQAAAPVDPDLAEIEAILRDRGIS